MIGMRSAAGLSAAAVTALTVAACGGGSPPAAQQTATSGPAGARATVAVAHTSLGDILVDPSGRTLYLFEKDKGGRSACTGACATSWPPLTVSGAPTAGPGVAAAKLGTTMRQDGKRQVTYAGHPLYRFSGDTKPGDTKGEGIDGFGGEWYAVSPQGAAVEEKPSSGGGAYGY